MSPNLDYLSEIELGLLLRKEIEQGLLFLYYDIYQHPVIFPMIVTNILVQKCIIYC